MSAPTLELQVRPAGLYLLTLDLFLDPEHSVERAFISHAHGDHGGGFGSGQIFASHETMSLLQARHGAIGGTRLLGWDESLDVPIEGGTARLSIAPAGHVLGAAQLVIDHPKGRFVYTGDYRTGEGPTHAEGAPVECDTLAIESTFGLPMFHFPDRTRTIAEIVSWCRSVLDSGETPVLLAYALGKSQELAHALIADGLSVIAHGASYRMCEAYEALGIELGIKSGALRPYAEERKRRSFGGVLIAPPRAAATPMIKGKKGYRVAYVSGWAVVDASIERFRASAGFALSDHADFDDLMETIRGSRARFVYTTHGEPVVFARLLNEAGIKAEPREVRPIDDREDTIE